MASLNKVLIMGRLGQAPDLRYTQSQTPVVSLNVATTEYRQGADGQRQEMTEWHKVIVWSRQAENCAKYLTKGSPVFIEGRLQTRSWDDKATGQKRYATEIVATQVQFLPAGGARDAMRDAPPPGDNDYGFMPSQGPASGAMSTDMHHFPHAEPQNTSSGYSQGPSLSDIPF